jgi:hypothetical protein
MPESDKEEKSLWGRVMKLAQPYAIGAAIGGGVASGFAAYRTPTVDQLADAFRPIIAEQVRLAVTHELDPMRRELATARLHAEQAKNDSAVLKDLVAGRVSEMANKISDMAVSIGRIDERTRSGKP